MAAKSTRPAPETGSARRDRPWMLPTSRKLRNLLSISLRNLSLTPPSPRRQRTKTIDDDGLPSSLVSPARLVALREQRPLEHSRSSRDLRAEVSAVREEGAVTDDEEQGLGHTNGSPRVKGRVNGHPRTPARRPTLAKMRRRSTLEWANATPQRRQEKLENVTAERMADLFFSMHVQGVEGGNDTQLEMLVLRLTSVEPVYVSETVERTMNPTFRHIDWSACGPGVTRSSHLSLRLWVKSAKLQSWRQLMEMKLSLTGLQYLGKSLEQWHQPLPQNAIIFHLTDGVYTTFTCLSDYIPPPSVPPPRSTSTQRVLPTSSFDALLRLSKLDDSVQDALTTRNKIAADLERLLEANKQALTDRDRVPEAEDRLKTIDYAKKTVVKQLEKGRKQQEEKRAALTSRRQRMQADLEHRKSRTEQIRHARPELQHFRDDFTTRHLAIQSQRRRICEDLQKIYPILAVPGKSLAFTLRGLPLPNSGDNDADADVPPDKLAAALGHAAHLLNLLSFYLAQPLPYPVNSHGSTSTIEDHISLLKTTASTTQNYQDERALRTYPLFSKGVPRFRYEYGGFLLNKDIQLLLESAYGVRVVDLRQTLPNLKYLLYVATAGEGELPARKAGGVRGLLGGAKPGAVERTGSEESTGSALSGLLFGEGKGHGGTRDAVESLRKSFGAVDGKGKGKKG
ncbi:hypothetical protein LTR53_009581 [Teratosphaeriaceae sp. CCFEE 6253]|nr:hypothetical protein LTR53_009581 [Teratosphaeriaceae sp. CCFEE 6253]